MLGPLNMQSTLIVSAVAQKRTCRIISVPYRGFQVDIDIVIYTPANNSSLTASNAKVWSNVPSSSVAKLRLNISLIIIIIITIIMDFYGAIRS